MSYYREYIKLVKFPNVRTDAQKARLLYLAQVISGNFESFEDLVKEILPKQMKFGLHFSCESDHVVMYFVKVLVHNTPKLSSKGSGRELRVASERCLESLNRRVSSWQDDDSPQAEKTHGVRKVA